jgi:hypothetical protein
MVPVKILLDQLTNLAAKDSSTAVFFFQFRNGFHNVVNKFLKIF